MSVIRGGKVVFPFGVAEADVEIENGKITRVAKLVKGAPVINARGRLVLPGAIDIHVHLREPSETKKEDWATGTAAAAHGGVTTVLDMPNNNPPIIDARTLEEKRRCAARKAVVDFGFYLGITQENLGQLKIHQNKICGYKLFLAHSTGGLGVTEAVAKRAFLEVAKTIRPLVVHAEDGKTIAEASRRFLDPANPLEHGKRRPAEAETTAVKNCVQWAKSSGAKLHLTHLSTAKSIELAAGVSSDVCLPHLFLTEADLKSKGSFAKTNPPVRTKANQAALWEGLRTGKIMMIASDHAPHTIEEKKKKFIDAPSGVPSLDVFLPLLLDAVTKKKLSLPRLAALTSFNPALRFGLVGKGLISPGFDADLAIVDMKKMEKVDGTKHFTKCGWSPYEGRRLMEKIEKTLCRGEIVYDRGEIIKRRGKETNYRGCP